MAQAKRATRLLEKPTFDVTVADATLTAFEKVADDTVAYARAHKGETPLMWSMMETAIEDFRRAAKERFRRVRDKTPYNQGEKMMMSNHAGWMVAGSAEKLRYKYNQLVQHDDRAR